MKITKLEPGETMQDRTRAEQLYVDCGKVADAIRKNPGLSSKVQIGQETGLDAARVHQCIKRINSNETSFSRVDYGERQVKDGLFAGQTRRGWFPMGYASYQPVMNHADEHSSLVERGVRRSRVYRLLFARGLSTNAARAAVASIEERLGIDFGELEGEELETAIELLLQELDA
jgi:hypothetical protein